MTHVVLLTVFALKGSFAISQHQQFADHDESGHAVGAPHVQSISAHLEKFAPVHRVIR